MNSQRSTTFKDTSSLYTISNTDNQSSGPPLNSPDRELASAPPQRLRVRADKAKSQRANNKKILFKFNSHKNSGQKVEGEEVMEKVQPPTSARALNPLDAWMAKKRFIDKQSSVRSGSSTDSFPVSVTGSVPDHHLRHIDKNELQIYQIKEEDHEANSTHNNSRVKPKPKTEADATSDLSYLDRLQSSLIFEPDLKQNSKGEQSTPKLKQNSNSLNSQESQNIQQKKQEPSAGSVVHKSADLSNPLNTASKSNTRSPQTQLTFEVDPKSGAADRFGVHNPILVSQSNTESLFFNPAEAAQLDALPNLLASSSQMNPTQMFLKEALDHVSGENEMLRDQLHHTQELLTVHKKLLDEVLKKSVDTVNECKETGSKLKQGIDSQAAYLANNKHFLDSSAITNMSTCMDFDPLNQCNCKQKQELWDSQRTEYQTKQAELLTQVHALQTEISQLRLVCKQSQNQLLAKQQKSGSSQQHGSSQVEGLHSDSSGDSDDRKYAAFKKVLMPILEDFTDENDQLIFQDDEGRFFKIAMCDADAEEGEDEDDPVASTDLPKQQNVGRAKTDSRQDIEELEEHASVIEPV